MDIHGSARRHGVEDDDMRHPVDQARVHFELDRDDEPQRFLVLGPDRAGNLLEIVVMVTDTGEDA